MKRVHIPRAGLLGALPLVLATAAAAQQRAVPQAPPAGPGSARVAQTFCAADDCTDPDPISGLGIFAWSNFLATTDGSPTACGQIERDIWCEWTSDVTGYVVVLTCVQTVIDTRLAVYDLVSTAGPGCAGPAIACDDDFCGDQSAVTFWAEAGVPYLIRLGGATSDDHFVGLMTIARDCNQNRIPDLLDVALHHSADCNWNLVPDECELGENDCNVNGVPDECDVDMDGDGIPDECEEPVDLDCEEFDRTETLTANDTLTMLTSVHNPQQEQGYFWAYATNAAGQPIGFDHLIGQLLVLDGLQAFLYSTNAVDFRAGVEEGALTDLDADGIRDLDGSEYDWAPGEILVPRFFGQTADVRSELILLGLSGGARFTTTANFLVYNDNEDQFSTQYTFRCWDKVGLFELSSVFGNDFLADFSGDDPTESALGLETGWFRLFGGVASSDFFSLPDPAVYGVLVERIGGSYSADLPFERCTQSGHLLPRTVGGDNSETNGAPSDQDCGTNVDRLEPGSLLLFPEFDNRGGDVTVFTVTNTSQTDDVRVHFIYVSRYGLP